MNLAIMAVLSLLLIANSGVCAEPSPTMKVISVKVLVPNESRGETYWIADPGHVRVEIPAEVAGAPMVTIVNDPNMWIVDLGEKTARHIVDKHPPLVAHFPVCNNAANPGSKINKLEFGKELEFFRNAAIRPLPTTYQSKVAHQYEIKLGISTVTFITSSDDVPLKVTCEGDGHVLSLEYLRYEEVKTDSKLFAAPIGVEIRDEKP